MEKTKTLDNGLKIVAEERPDLQLVYIYLCIKVGSIFESENQHGLSHFIEHCIFAGTKNYPNEDAVWESIENIGGSANAYTSKDHTMIFCKLLPKYLENGIELLADLALNPKFEKNDIQREKKVLMSEILRTESNSSNRSLQQLIENLYPQHPIRHDILGDRKNVNSINEKLMREFHSEYYLPSNMVLGVIGNVRIDEISRIAARCFSVNKPYKPAKMPSYESLGKNTETENKSDNEQALVFAGFRTENCAHEDAPLIHLTSYAIGQMATFGLRNIIRFKKGLAYSISSGWNSYISGSYSFIAAKCNEKNMDTIIEQIHSFFNLFNKEMLNENTFTRIQNSYLGNYLQTRENPETWAKNLTYCSAYGAPLNGDEIVRSTTPQKINEIVQKYFKNYAIVKTKP